MNIYRLNYPDKETAIRDLLMKKAYVRSASNNEDLLFGEGIQAVVEIGQTVISNATYDENMVELTPAILSNNYAYDVMSEQVLSFVKYRIFPTNPMHSFAGVETFENKPLTTIK